MNENGIYSASFKNFPNSGETTEENHLTLFKITCCGLSIDPTGYYVAIGDFDGAVNVFRLTDCALVNKTHVNTSVRCIT